jgi:hypothetical protein
MEERNSRKLLEEMLSLITYAQMQSTDTLEISQLQERFLELQRQIEVHPLLPEDLEILASLTQVIASLHLAAAHEAQKVHDALLKLSQQMSVARKYHEAELTDV